METIRRFVNSKIIRLVAIAVSLFHLLNVAGIITMSTMPIRIIHLLAMLVIVFAKVGAIDNRKGSFLYAIHISFALAAIFCSVYLFVRWEDLINSGGASNNTDIIVGTIMLIVVLEATRKSVGWPLALICIVFFAYPFIGKYLPGILSTRHYSFSRIISLLFTTSEGFYGIPISVSSNYIILFCIYGAFLSEFNAGKFLFDISSVITKRLSAATAKTSIIFSALIGMISGSAAGNVAITGSLTIPMMIQEGYRKDQAGAVSAVSATGGQIMPPVMGAAAFIMASIVGVPYATIMKSAIVPAVLYFFSIFVIVHLIAKKQNVGKETDLAKEVNLSTTLREGWHLALPIIALIAMMIIGYSPFKAAYISIITLLVVSVINGILRKTFKLGDFITRILRSLEKGATDTVPIAVACAAAGIIAGILSVTGLGSKLSSLIVSISSGYLIVALFLTMIISIILGMGLPTTAAYLVLASVVTPALVTMGTSVIAAHMFVFYFGCISTITPPVALASYVAAGIANANLNKVGWTAFKYGIVSFILPFMFVFGEGLLLQGSTFTIIQTIFSGIIGVLSIAIAIVGYSNRNISLVQRAVLMISGLLMVIQGTYTDIVGILILLFILVPFNKILRKEV